jgi:hypothetical protein
MKTRLPNGGPLSPRRFLQLGMFFGFHGKTDPLFAILLMLKPEQEVLIWFTVRSILRVYKMRTEWLTLTRNRSNSAHVLRSGTI